MDKFSKDIHGQHLFSFTGFVFRNDRDYVIIVPDFYGKTIKVERYMIRKMIYIDTMDGLDWFRFIITASNMKRLHL